MIKSNLKPSMFGTTIFLLIEDFKSALIDLRYHCPCIMNEKVTNCYRWICGIKLLKPETDVEVVILCFYQTKIQSWRNC